MKNSIVTVLISIIGLSGVCLAAFETPLTDTYQTMALWNMDSLSTLSDGKVITYDQDTWGRYNRHLQFFNGTGVHGGTLAAGKSGFGNAVQFDGVNDFAKSFLKIPITEGFRIEMWVNLDSTKTDTNWIAEVSEVWRLYSDTNATRINFLVKDADGNWSTQLRKAITPDKWVHLTASFENGTAYLSVDGTTQYGSVTLPTSAMYKAGQEDYLWIGCRSNGDRFFKGLIDDVRLTDPAAQIPTWADTYTDTVRGTYALYHFDEIANGLAADDTSASSRVPLNLTAYGNPQIVSDVSYPKDNADFASSVSFDGMADYFRCEVMPPYEFDPSNFKFETWIKLNPQWYTIQGGLYWIVGNDSMFRLYAESTGTTASGARLRFYVFPSDGTAAVLTNLACGELAGWNHIAAEFYNGTAKLYVNGTLKATATLPTTSARIGTNKLIIGSYNGSQRMFWGQMDEIRISSVVMPEAQCGDFGYLESDINKDCIVDILDLKLMLADWLRCTADEAGCETSF